MDFNYQFYSLLPRFLFGGFSLLPILNKEETSCRKPQGYLAASVFTEKNFIFRLEYRNYDLFNYFFMKFNQHFLSLTSA